MKNDYKSIFVGENKYTTGLIFWIASTMGFFNHMRKLDIDEKHTFLMLLVLMFIAGLVSRF